MGRSVKGRIKIRIYLERWCYAFRWSRSMCVLLFESLYRMDNRVHTCVKMSGNCGTPIDQWVQTHTHGAYASIILLICARVCTYAAVMHYANFVVTQHSRSLWSFNKSIKYLVSALLIFSSLLFSIYSDQWHLLHRTFQSMNTCAYAIERQHLADLKKQKRNALPLPLPRIYELWKKCGDNNKIFRSTQKSW